jgi:hypothetical protein
MTVSEYLLGFKKRFGPIEDEVHDAKFFTQLPCAVCALFFSPEELVDGLCPDCLESEEAAWATFMEIEEEPF